MATKKSTKKATTKKRTKKTAVPAKVKRWELDDKSHAGLVRRIEGDKAFFEVADNPPQQFNFLDEHDEVLGRVMPFFEGMQLFWMAVAYNKEGRPAWPGQRIAQEEAKQLVEQAV